MLASADRHEKDLAMLPQDLEVLAYEESPIGMICLRRRDVPSAPGTSAYEITVDHQFLMSSLATESERLLATRAVELHAGQELSLLVGGLGLGYTAHAALGCPSVARVEVVELLPQVIGWLERGLIPLAAELLADRRLTVVRDDVYRRVLAEPTTRYDAILIDVDTSPERRLGSVSEPFYTEAGLAACARHLAPGGLLGVWSAEDSAELEEALRRAFPRVLAEAVTFVNPMLEEEETNWLFFASVS
jgi:spermidine synthase